MKVAAIFVICALAFSVTISLRQGNPPPSHAKPSYCKTGERATVVGAGHDTDGALVVAYMCAK